MTQYLGLDVGGTNVRLAAWDGESEPVTVGESPLPPDYDSFLTLVSELTRSYAAAAVGVGLPGVAFDQEVVWVPNAPFLEGDRLARDISAMTGAPVFCSNDAHAAMLAESRLGAAAGASVALLMSVGTGVGGALSVGGRVLRGANGAAGSLGWVHLGTPLAADPDHGELELLASGSALSARAKAMGVSARTLVARARAGDSGCAAAFNEVAAHLGVALATLVSVFDPAVAVITGGVSEEFDLLAPTIRSVVSERASPAGRAVPIVAAHLGSRAGAVGAALLGKEGRAAFL